MKKYLFLYAVLTTALLAYGYTRYRHETRRLTQNQNALASGIEHYRTRLGQEAASVQALRLRCAEFERLRAEDAASIRTDSVACRVESTDTLRQVVHRVPRRFLFIRWGTKALRQEIVSSNPHTRIVYSDYVKFER